MWYRRIIELKEDQLPPQKEVASGGVPFGPESILSSRKSGRKSGGDEDISLFKRVRVLSTRTCKSYPSSFEKIQVPLLYQ